MLHPGTTGIYSPAGLGGSPSALSGLLSAVVPEEEVSGISSSPGPASVFRCTLVGSHPLPKPLFLLNSLAPQPFSQQDLGGLPGGSNLTPGSSSLAVPPHTLLLRQQLLRGQRALASGSLGAPGGHPRTTGIVSSSPVPLRRSTASHSWLGSNPTASMLPFCP